MNVMSTILLFIVLGFFSFMLDIKTAPNDLYASCEIHFPVLLIHHIIWVFTMTGWLSFNPYILYLYLFSNIVHAFLWYVFNNECILTMYMNEKCKTTDTKLRTALLFTKKKFNLNTNRFLDVIIFSLTTAYVIYKLTTKKIS